MMSWQFWFLILFLIFFVLWLFFGGKKKYPYVGLSALSTDARISKYLDPTYDLVDIPTTPVSSVSTISPSSPVESVNRVTHITTPLLTPVSVHSVRTPVPSPRILTAPIQPILPPTGTVDVTPQLPLNIEPEPPSTNIYDFSKIGYVSKKEAECRKILENIYHLPFPRVRPDFLKNPETNCNLELDGFNPDLMIAFEYNGEQHYKYPHPFHTSYDKFVNQIRRDQYKLNICDLLGIYLITVPYNVPLSRLESYIRYYLPENQLQRQYASS